MILTKRKTILLGLLAILAIVYGGLIFSARYLPCDIGLAKGHVKDGDTLTDLGLTRFVLGANLMRLIPGDRLELSYASDAPLGALYLELSTVHSTGPRYKSMQYIPGNGSGRISFIAPYAGVYNLAVSATRLKTADGPMDTTFDVRYEVRWRIKPASPATDASATP